MPYFTYTQINLGPITLYAWGLMVGLGFLAGYLIALVRAKQKNIDQHRILILTVLIFIASIIGARLGSLILFKTNGLIFYGGLIGAILISLYYLKNKKEFLKFADLLAPSIALGISIGRLGCFLIKDHPGAITNLPWAILWPDGILRHPVALYLSINGLILFLILLFLRNKLDKPGHLFIVFLTYYSFSRFFLEFTRVGDPQFLNLFISQWISILFFIYGIIQLCKRYGIVFQLKKLFKN